MEHNGLGQAFVAEEQEGQRRSITAAAREEYCQHIAVAGNGGAPLDVKGGRQHDRNEQNCSTTDDCCLRKTESVFVEG